MQPVAAREGMSAPPDRRLLRPARLVPLALACVVSAPCWPVLFFGQAFFYRDIYLFYLPQRELVGRLLRSGVWPLWDPFLHGGVPLWANPNNLVAHPTTLLYSLLPATTAFGLERLLGLELAALGAYALARRLDISRGGAFVAGAACALCGVTASTTNLSASFLALAPLAALLFAWQAWLGGGGRVALAATAGLAALCGMTAGVEAAACGAVLVVAFTLVSSHRPLSARLVGLATAGVTALLVSAPSWLPALGLIHGSARGAGLGLDEVAAWSLSPRRLPEIVVPGLLGRIDSLTDASFWGRRIEGEFSPLFVSIAIGPVVAMLAARGLIGGPLPAALRRVLASLAIASVVLALGRHLPGAGLLTEIVHLPVRYPVKLLMLSVVPVALLAGSGLDALAADPASKRRAWTLSMAGLAILLGLGTLAIFLSPEQFARAAGAWFQQDVSGSLAPMRAVLAMACAQAATAALLVHLVASARRALVLLAIPALAAAGLVRITTDAMPTMPAAALSEEPAAIPLLREALGDGRFCRIDDLSATVRVSSSDTRDAVRWYLETMRMSTVTRWGIPLVFTPDLDRLGPRRLAWMTTLLPGLDWPRRLALLRSASVTVVGSRTPTEVDGLEPVDIGRDDAWAYLVTGTSDPVRMITSARFVASEREAVAATTDPSRDPRSEVVIVSPGRGSGPPCEARVHPTRLGLLAEQQWTTESDCDAFLVLAIPFQAGIEARVDGRPAEILPADVAFCAVPVPAGRHVVSWRWRDDRIRLGLALGGLGLACMGALLLFGARLSQPANST